MAKRKGRSDKDSRRNAARSAAQIEDVPFAEATRTRYLNYALSVITSRALPDLRDGLKPVQRRILYAMWHDLHVTADSRHIKCAAVVGEVMKTYHPHGDQSIYDALVRMAQPFSVRETLIDGYGNFGSIDGDPPAAFRYTECRLTPIAQTLLSELREQTVNFRPNYASTAEEPIVLPAQYPNLLVNGVTGIAVGMATNIPPHNLKEVMQRADRAARQSRAAAGADPEVDSRARLSDRRRHTELGGGDPADLHHGAGDDQAARAVRAASRPAGGDSDHVDSVWNRKRRAGRADRGVDREGAGAAAHQRQRPEHGRRADLARTQARRQCRCGAGVSVQELTAADQLQHQSHVPAAGRRSGSGGSRPAGFEDDPPAVPGLPSGDRDSPAAVRAAEPTRADPYPRRLRDRLQESGRGDRDHPRQRGQGRRCSQADGEVRAVGDSGRRDSGDQALPAGQARDPRHHERACGRSANGRKRSSSYSRTSRPGGR